MARCRGPCLQAGSRRTAPEPSGRHPMADADIEAIRAQLAAHPRPADLAERRQRLDALGAQYPLPPGGRGERVRARGAAAEWTMPPEAAPARVILFLHGGGYISGS